METFAMILVVTVPLILLLLLLVLMFGRHSWHRLLSIFASKHHVELLRDYCSNLALAAPVVAGFLVKVIGFAEDSWVNYAMTGVLTTIFFMASWKFTTRLKTLDSGVSAPSADPGSTS